MCKSNSGFSAVLSGSFSVEPRQICRFDYLTAVAIWLLEINELKPLFSATALAPNRCVLLKTKIVDKFIKLLLTASSIVLSISCQDNLKFDSKLWKQNGNENITLNLRMKMVNDLIESEILLNKNKKEIEKIIGKPSKLENSNDTLKKFYPVQEIYGLNIDPIEMKFIEITFNKGGKSKSVKLISTK